jgi:hypothetical protein
MASEPDSIWTTQVSRNLTDAGDGCLTGKRFLIYDRDPLFTVTLARHWPPQAFRSSSSTGLSLARTRFFLRTLILWPRG